MGLDLLGGLLPPAAALGHLALNAWWGAENPSDTELLAGYDKYLHRVPLVGAFAGEQEHQDVWLGRAVGDAFQWARDAIRGDVDTELQQEVQTTSSAPSSGYQPTGGIDSRNYAAIAF